MADPFEAVKPSCSGRYRRGWLLMALVEANAVSLRQDLIDPVGRVAMEEHLGTTLGSRTRKCKGQEDGHRVAASLKCSPGGGAMTFLMTPPDDTACHRDSQVRREALAVQGESSATVLDGGRPAPA